MKLTLNKKSHTEIAFCVCQDPKNTLLIRPQRENRKFDIQFCLTYFIKNTFLWFLKKDALESQDARKMGLRVCRATQWGFMTNILFYKKSNFLFSILIHSPGFPGDPWGSPGIPGTPGGPGDPLKPLKTLTNLKNPKNYKNPKKS